jgi:hypothetical protein
VALPLAGPPFLPAVSLPLVVPSLPQVASVCLCLAGSMLLIGSLCGKSSTPENRPCKPLDTSKPLKPLNLK